MLSYRHIYHAGNHADVLKHFCLYQVLTYYNQKPKPYVYIDTHAGTALYDLQSEQAALKQEHAQGFELIAADEPLGEPLQSFVDFMRAQSSLPPTTYMGSAAIAALLLREGDQLRLFERHPQDFPLLQRNIDSLAARARSFVSFDDGYQGLIANLPPHTRRGVILIDPSYEIKEEYANLPNHLQEALLRFPQGCYLIWIPQLPRIETKQLPALLKNMAGENYLHVSLSVSAPSEDGFGMYGSQLFIINPPYILPSLLSSTLPQLVRLLGQDDHATSTLDTHLT